MVKFLVTPLPLVSPVLQDVGLPALTPLVVAEGAGVISPDEAAFINLADTILYQPLPADILGLGNLDLGDISLPAGIDLRTTDLQTALMGVAVDFKADTGPLLVQMQTVAAKLQSLLVTFLPDANGEGILSVPILDPTPDANGVPAGLQTVAGIFGMHLNSLVAQ